MMYVNIGCTCAAQVILSFIFSIMCEPVQIWEGETDKTQNKLVWEIQRDNLVVFRQECPKPIKGASTPKNNHQVSELQEPLNAGINRDSVTNQIMDSPSSSRVGLANMDHANIKSEEVRHLLMMFFSFCDPIETYAHKI